MTKNSDSKGLLNEKYYLNRELSWLEFNRRCLAEAEDPTNPLLERVKFLAICYGNMDEFFMIRVPGMLSRTPIPGPDYSIPFDELMGCISGTVQELVDEYGECWSQLKGELAQNGML